MYLTAVETKSKHHTESTLENLSMQLIAYSIACKFFKKSYPPQEHVFATCQGVFKYRRPKGITSHRSSM